jgi:hypothetical protein
MHFGGNSRVALHLQQMPDKGERIIAWEMRGRGGAPLVLVSRQMKRNQPSPALLEKAIRPQWG